MSAPKSIAQDIIDRAHGDHRVIDRLCDELFQSIEEEPWASVYVFEDDSRLRTGLTNGQHFAEVLP